MSLLCIDGDDRERVGETEDFAFGETIGGDDFRSLIVGPGTRAASLGWYEGPTVWDRKTGEVTHWDEPYLVSAVFSPDESVVYGLDKRRGIIAWDGASSRDFDLP